MEGWVETIENKDLRLFARIHISGTRNETTLWMVLVSSQLNMPGPLYPGPIQAHPHL